MKRAIITGATGAIGMALIQALIDKKIEVLVLCREGSERNNRIPEHPLVKKRYCALAQLCTLENTEDISYDVFFHFAWDGTFGNARNDMYLQNRNVKYAIDAVHAARRFGCHTFIGAGSQAEYGRVEGTLKPDTPVFPENGYGIAKLCAGQMTGQVARQLGMNHIWARILSVYGPYDGEKTMVMSAVRCMLAGEKTSFTKGEQQWDYLYSRDAAEMMIALAEKGKNGQVYCLGSGNAKPLASYIEKIKEACKYDGEPGIGDIPYPEGQVMYLCADISRLMEDTGYCPKYTFDEGIKETIEWYRKEKK